MTDFATAICDAGVKAVFKAKTIWGADQENEVREEFLSALMAVNLHRALGKPVRVEVDYTIIYGEVVGLPITADTITKVGGYRADIVVYDQSGGKFRPKAIVETKKFAEGANVYGILADLRKGDPVDLRTHVRVYAAVFVCETRDTLEDRKRVLEDALEGQGRIVFSSPQNARGWRWCFGCFELPAEREPIQE
jgi:hypothetical protein